MAAHEANTDHVIPTLTRIVDRVAAGDVPEAVVHEARRRLLDAIGVMVAGAPGDTVRQTHAAAMELGGQGASSLVGYPERTSPDRAALINGTSLRYLDYMDGHPGPYPAHACANIPPILAVAEHVNASGPEVMRAIVIGYEVQIRLQLAAGDPSITQYGWAGVTNLGFSIPLAIGALLGLTAEQVAHATAISITHAAALDAPSRGHIAASKSCVDAMVGMSSVVATMLAKQGITGPLSAFEGPSGYLQAVARQYQPDVLLAPLDRFRILDVYDKRYNAGKYGQTVAAAGLAALAKVPGGVEQVDRLVIRLAERDCSQQLQDEASRRRPEARDTANHSIYYTLAAALVFGDVLPSHFTEACLHHPRVLNLIDRTTLEADAELTSYWPAANPAEVEITAADGRVYRERVIYAPGHSRNPLSDRDLQAKFRGLVGETRSNEDAERLVDLCMRFETLGSIRELMAVTRAGAPVPALSR